MVTHSVMLPKYIHFCSFLSFFVNQCHVPSFISLCCSFPLLYIYMIYMYQQYQLFPAFYIFFFHSLFLYSQRNPIHHSKASSVFVYSVMTLHTHTHTRMRTGKKKFLKLLLGNSYQKLYLMLL